MNCTIIKREGLFEKRLARFMAFKQQSGLHSGSIASLKGTPLGGWLNNLRQKRIKQQLAPEQIAQLDRAGFDWGLKPSRWEERYQELKAYQQRHGHCRVPGATSPLGNWVRTQRRKKSKCRLSPEQESKLNQLGFDWEPGRSALGLKALQTMWEQRYRELKAFQKRHGHCRVPYRYSILGIWVYTQRQEKRKQRLAPEREEQLNQLGFDWALDRFQSRRASLLAVWEGRYAELKAHLQRHNRPPRSTTPLGKWVSRQRHYRRQNRLSASQVARLDQLGFDWKQDRQKSGLRKWEERFEELRRYRQQHGEIGLVGGQPLPVSLVHWINNQRQNRRLNRLSPERVTKLDQQGFVWKPKEARWEQWYEELKRFKTVHGHCPPPSRSPARTPLERWSETQRLRKQRQQLAPEQVAKLDQLGFHWKPDQSRAARRAPADGWEQRHEELKQFKAAHGHLRLPPGCLAVWASLQRKKREELATDRLAQLDGLGFVWHPRAKGQQSQPTASH